MNKKRIKIAFFSDVLKENLDGVTYTIYNIIKRIPSDRFDYMFITPLPPENPSSIPYPVYVCPYIKFPLYQAYPLAMPFFSRKMTKVIDEFGPDLIHFTTPAFLGKYALNYAKERSLPLLSTYHTHFLSYIDYYTFFKFAGGIALWKRLAGKVMRHFYNQCVYSLVPTDPIRNELVENGIEPERLLTWGRGIDAEQFNQTYRDETYMDSLAGKGTKRILFVSRLVWEKEIKTLVGIYKKLESTRPDIKMILTGDGPQRRYMEKTMPRAVFTGKLLGPELSRIYASSDLFIFPSITETFGNVVLEALSSGLPCVVAAQGGPMGIVKNGVTGFHARPKEPDDFVSKIVMILDNDALFKKMKKEAVAYARSQNWDTLCGQMFALYERIYNNSRGNDRGNAVGK